MPDGRGPDSEGQRRPGNGDGVAGYVEVEETGIGGERLS